MADKADKSGNLALIFGGGGGDAAPAGGPSSDAGEERELAAGDEYEEPDGPPPDFAVHAAEAFPELAGDDARIDALYRTIKACHPVA